MFARDSAASRLYGTYQWRADVSTAKCGAASDDNRGARLCSRPFRLCGYLWFFVMYPTGIEGKPDRVLIGLQAVGTPPPEAIDFQLWIQNHTNTDKSAVGETLHRAISKDKPNASYGGLSAQKALDPNEGFMENGALTVGIHMCVIAQEDAKQQNALACSQPNTSLATSISCCYDDPATADVVLKAGSTSVHAHKIVLAAQSAMFKAMFQPGTKEGSCGVVEMKEIDGETLRQLVAFLYGHGIKGFGSVPLFVAADAHQVGALRWICLQMLITKITATTVLEYAQLADRLSDSTLMDTCIQFLTESDDRVKVAEQDEMRLLMQNNPDLAQKLLVAVMKQTTPKRKADKMS